MVVDTVLLWKYNDCTSTGGLVYGENYLSWF